MGLAVLPPYPRPANGSGGNFNNALYFAKKHKHSRPSYQLIQAKTKRQNDYPTPDFQTPTFVRDACTAASEHTCESRVPTADRFVLCSTVRLEGGSVGT